MEGEFYCPCSKTLIEIKYFCLNCHTIFCSKKCKEAFKKSHRAKCEKKPGFEIGEVRIETEKGPRSFLIDAEVNEKLYGEIEPENRPLYIREDDKIIPMCDAYRVFEIIQKYMDKNFEKLLDSVPENQGQKGKLFIFKFQSYIDLVKKLKQNQISEFFESHIGSEKLEAYDFQNKEYVKDQLRHGFNFVLIEIKTPIPFCSVARFDLTGELFHAIKGENDQLIDLSGLMADKSTPETWPYFRTIEEEESSE